MSKCSKSIKAKCQSLRSHGKLWKIWPEGKINGIYVIKQGGFVIYVGRSINIRRRLQSHCYGKRQRIDRHILGTNPRTLTYNYVHDVFQPCNEHCYVHLIGQLQGKWPKYNMQKGNTCDNPKQCKKT